MNLAPTLDSKGEEVGDFAVANVIDVVAALDRERSLFDRYPPDYFAPQRRGQIAGIQRAVLRAEKLSGHDIVRLEEFPVSVYASEHFKDVFERGNFTGYSFSEVRLA
jgi:hypothetical protein